MRLNRFLTGTALLFLSACSSSQGETETEPGSDNSSEGDETDSQGELTDVACDSDTDCNDGAFCNGVESCDEGFCRLGLAPTCDDGIDCTTDSCSHANNACSFQAPDADGDGYRDAACEGPDGVSLGQDCDDSDSDRFPGNPERCTPESLDHDEDCDPLTFGHLDEDLDGYVSSACCNGSGDEQSCGEDCDDGDYRRYPEHPEICDDIDNDCDGEVDVNTKEVPWYPDLDGDHFGKSSGDAIISCAPVDGHSLRDTDCDDGTGAVHSAAVEVCDGADNDCDGETDEGGVCACAPEGNVRACACGPSATGVQSCVGGLWNECDCTECVTGTVDCLGELLPRECIAGRWVVNASCRGVRPICLTGKCVCADGSEDCEEISDVVPPFVVASVPADRTSLDSQTLSTLAVVFTENVRMPDGSGDGLTLINGLGSPVAGTIQYGGSSITFTPTEPLHAGTSYELLVSAAISDLAGNALGAPETIAFQTDPSVTLVPLSSDPDVSHSGAVLDVSPSGEAILLAQQTSGHDSPGGSVLDGTAAFFFNGADWGAGTIMNQEFPHAVTIDDRGYATAQMDHPSGTAIVSYLGGAWSQSPVVATGYDVPVGVHSTTDGHMLSVVQDAQGITSLDYRDPLDVFGNVTRSVPGVVSVDSDLGEDVDGVVAYVSENSAGYMRSTTDIFTWLNPTVTLIDMDGPLFETAVAMGPDGLATVAHTQALSDGGLAFQQILVNDVDAAGQFSGAWIQPLGFQESNATQITMDADAAGNLALAYVSGRSDVYVVRRLGSEWQTPQKVTSNGLVKPTIEDLTMSVASDGTILVIWRSTNGVGGLAPSDLYGSKYVDGLGWQTQLLIAGSTGSSPLNPQLAANGVGLAHVAFEMDGVQTFTW